MSRVEKDTNSNKMYLKIVDGSLRQKASEGHPEAIRRDWTAGGESGTVWEIPSKAAFGIITDVSFYEGEKDGRKFTTLNITLDENEDGKVPVLTAGIDTKYAQEILKKLPNVDFENEVRIRPYSYLKEGDDKNTVGVEITQRGSDNTFSKKVNDYFYDWDKREVKHGYPKPPKEKEDMTSKDWRRYFEDANDFVIEYIKSKIVPKFTVQSKADPIEALDDVLEEKDAINPDDIPF